MSVDTLPLTIENNTSQNLLVLRVSDFDQFCGVTSSGVEPLEQLQGGSVLKAGQQGTVLLTTQTQVVILANATSMFPISIGVFTLSAFTSQRLVARPRDEVAMRQALGVAKNIIAAPFSDTSAKLLKALDDAFENKQYNFLSDYFGAVGAGPNLTPLQLAASLQWMKSYAYFWGLASDGSLGLTYDLFSDGAGGSLGTVTFSRKPVQPVMVEPDDKTCGLQIQYTPLNGSATDLSCKGAYLVETSGLAVTGGVLSSSQLFDVDQQELCPVLVGTLGEAKVVGVPRWYRNTAA